MYFFIEKLDSVDGQLDRSIIGYVDDSVDFTSFSDDEQAFYDWVEQNKTNLEEGVISTTDYIDANGVVYLASSGTDDVSCCTNISEIQDINNPEVVS